MRKLLFFFAISSLVILSINGCNSGNKKQADFKVNKPWMEEALQKSARQYKTMIDNLPEGVQPNSINKNGELKTVKPTSWVAGFYPGTLLYLYMATADNEIYEEGLKRVKLMVDQQFLTKHHDVGFMMNCSYGNLLKIDPKKEYEQVLINSAYSLSKRYNDKVKSIRSWGEIDDEEKFVVIIDNMMNLELLLWAAKVTGDKQLYDIAVNHANTTMNNHFRPDNSSFHVVEFHPATGEVLKKRTAQGFADDSAWARGQAWGLYGFTMMYRETNDEEYLNMANKIASFIINHPNLPEDKVPYWDFNDPKIPDTYRDASAGAIIASSLIELSKYNQRDSDEYLQTAVQILKTLASDEFSSEIGENKGFLLTHSVANLNRNADVDVPLPYADYYFVEALYRYLNYFSSSSF